MSRPKSDYYCTRGEAGLRLGVESGLIRDAGSKLATIAIVSTTRGPVKLGFSTSYLKQVGSLMGEGASYEEALLATAATPEAVTTAARAFGGHIVNVALNGPFTNGRCLYQDLAASTIGVSRMTLRSVGEGILEPSHKGTDRVGTSRLLAALMWEHESLPNGMESTLNLLPDDVREAFPLNPQ